MSQHVHYCFVSYCFILLILFSLDVSLYAWDPAQSIMSAFWLHSLS
jgi:hypothetical protein